MKSANLFAIKGQIEIQELDDCPTEEIKAEGIEKISCLPSKKDWHFDQVDA